MDERSSLQGVGRGIGQIDIEAGDALLQIYSQLLTERSAMAQHYGCQQRETSARRIGQHAADNILATVLLHLLPANGANRVASSRKEHTQIVVHFC